MDQHYPIRRATAADEPALRALHRAALLELSGGHYTDRQLSGFLADVVTVDRDLIADGTYFVAEHDGAIVASGGWTLRRPSYARNTMPAAPDCATIRAVFTSPSHTRRGLARSIVELAEEEAVLHGLVERIDLCATLPAVPLYLRLGYTPLGAETLPLSNGDLFSAIAMTKSVSADVARRPQPASTVVVPAFQVRSAAHV